MLKEILIEKKFRNLNYRAALELIFGRFKKWCRVSAKRQTLLGKIFWPLPTL